VVLATQVGIAIESARLYGETERKGPKLQRLQVLEDRELHDGVIRSLFRRENEPSRDASRLPG
jgi:GAF domain-containing protein